ncbi:MAG: alpha/beta hydrolase-fold protein [Janthinobacterium lividum]
MLNYLLLLCCWLTTFTCLAQPRTPSCSGQTVEIYSRVLQEKRTVWVHLPATTNPQERFPVLYVLDGESHFASTVAITEQLAGRWPRLIVVGVLNTNRSRDLTPTHVAPHPPFVDPGAAAVSGGGELFSQFLRTELTPRLDSLYPTTPYRVLSGHSLGGLAVVHMLVTHPEAFSAYLALDPSLWWDQERTLQAAEATLQRANFAHKALFLAISQPLLPPGVDTLAAQHDHSDYSAPYRATIHLAQTLRTSPPPQLRWQSKYYPHEQHGTVQLLGQYDGLKFLFDDYSFRPSQFTFRPNADLDSAIVAHFARVSRQMGYLVLPDEQLVNNLGYQRLGQHQLPKALAFFTRNVANYPRSANAYDSLGDAYAQQGNKRRAMLSYEHSLRLAETPDTRRKLRALQAKH